MNTDGVNEAFELIITELESVTRQLNSEGARAFAESRYADAESLSDTGKRLDGFRGKLSELRTEWNTDFDLKTRQRVIPTSSDGTPRSVVRPRPSNRMRAPSSRIRITMPDGEVISFHKANEAMAAAIEKIGLERVSALEVTVSGVPLVSRQKHPSYSQVKKGEWYVCTHANNRAKKRTLDRVAAELRERMKTEILDD